MLTTRIPPGPPLIKSRQHPPMVLFTHTHWPTEHLIALYRDARQPRGVNGWMPVDLWSTFKWASAQLASTFLPLRSLAALTNIIYQRKIDLQMQKTAESHICSYYIYKKQKTATLYGKYFWWIFATGFNISCVTHHSNLQPCFIGCVLH